MRGRVEQRNCLMAAFDQNRHPLYFALELSPGPKSVVQHYFLSAIAERRIEHKSDISNDFVP